jgi:hypothetical protein
MFTGAAGAVLLLNQLFRIGARGDHERDDEASARAYFDAHGDWPASVPASGGRRWSLPAGVVTAEAEEAAARAAAGGRAGAAGADGAGAGAGEAVRTRSGEQPEPPAAA